VDENGEIAFRKAESGHIPAPVHDHKVKAEHADVE
jgi:hypothetical protein